MIDASAILELSLIGLASTVSALGLVTYCLHSGWNREMTSSFRDEFLDGSIALSESGELPAWAIAELVVMAEGIFSRLRLYRVLSVLYRINRGTLKLSEKSRKEYMQRENEIPMHLRDAWLRTNLNGILATTGADPILGAFARSQFLMMGKPDVSASGAPEIKLSAGRIHDAEFGLPHAVALAA